MNAGSCSAETAAGEEPVWSESAHAAAEAEIARLKSNPAAAVRGWNGAVPTVPILGAVIKADWRLTLSLVIDRQCKLYAFKFRRVADRLLLRMRDEWTRRGAAQATYSGS